jgi:Family of unknown function (DUF6356)
MSVGTLFRNLFIKHPASLGETYGEHLISALGFGTKMVVAGLACIIHGLLPAAFVTRGSDTIRSLHERMVMSRDKVR